MNVYKYPYDYKDKVITKFKKYSPILHTKNEKGYELLYGDNAVSIEIKNDKGNSLFIDLEDEITISYSNWHLHYYYEDEDDLKEAMEKVGNIIDNKECILNIYCDGKLFGSGSSLNKDNYGKEEVLEFMNSFIDISSYESFKKYGVLVKVNYWNESQNYEIFLNKENFV